MTFILGFILGAAAVYFAPLIPRIRKSEAAPAASEDDARRAARAAREYRNFMTYDGTAQGDD